MEAIIKKLVQGENLSEQEAQSAMEKVLDGGATEAQVSAFLVALRMKGETMEEITGCAKMLRHKAAMIRPRVSAPYVDCVGTGGDGANTFNISTTAAFVIAGAGIPVAKHGNRAISSRSGSADLLEKLGVNIMLTPAQTERCVEEAGIGFMFARTFHPFMKTVSSVRSQLCIRTIFNILGPISNPSGASCQVIGVFDPKLVAPIAQVLPRMGVGRGMVLSAVDDGMDELSTTGPTQVSEITDGAVTSRIVTPEEFGLPRAQKSALLGGTPQENVGITIKILNGEKGPRRDIVVLNAGAAIYCQGSAPSIRKGIALAENAIDTGAALESLHRLVRVSRRMEEEAV